MARTKGILIRDDAQGRRRNVLMAFDDGGEYVFYSFRARTKRIFVGVDAHDVCRNIHTHGELSQSGIIVQGEGCSTGSQRGDTAEIATADTEAIKAIFDVSFPFLEFIAGISKFSALAQ